MTVNSNSGCWVTKTDLLVAINRSRLILNKAVWKDYLTLCREYQYQPRIFRKPGRRTTKNLVKLLAENKNQLKRVRSAIHSDLDRLHRLATAPSHDLLVFVSGNDIEWVRW